MPKLYFVVTDKVFENKRQYLTGRWVYGKYENLGGGKAFVEKKPAFNFPHTGFKQIEKNKKSNPEGLEYPCGFKVWEKRA